MSTTKTVQRIALLSAFLLFGATCASAVTYYRVSDVQDWRGGGHGDPDLYLNEYIPADSPWTLMQVTETFETGHILGWGLIGGVQRIFGLTPLDPGDGNADGKVDGSDLALWQQDYDPLSTETDFFDGDWSGDGKVDGSDLALWQQNYNPLVQEVEFPYSPSIVHMPEPFTMLGLVMGVGMVGGTLWRRRRVR